MRIASSALRGFLMIIASHTSAAEWSKAIESESRAASKWVEAAKAVEFESSPEKRQALATAAEAAHQKFENSMKRTDAAEASSPVVIRVQEWVKSRDEAEAALKASNESEKVNVVNSVNDLYRQQKEAEGEVMAALAKEHPELFPGNTVNPPDYDLYQPQQARQQIEEIRKDFRAKIDHVYALEEHNAKLKKNKPQERFDKINRSQPTWAGAALSAINSLGGGRKSAVRIATAAEPEQEEHVLTDGGLEAYAEAVKRSRDAEAFFGKPTSHQPRQSHR